jgi:hypothetical protein
MRAVTIAALLAGTPALAQEPPTTVGLGSRAAAFETAGDVDTYRIRLVQGTDYAFGPSPTAETMPTSP